MIIEDRVFVGEKLVSLQYRLATADGEPITFADANDEEVKELYAAARKSASEWGVSVNFAADVDVIAVNAPPTEEEVWVSLGDFGEVKMLAMVDATATIVRLLPADNTVSLIFRNGTIVPKVKHEKANTV